MYQADEWRLFLFSCGSAYTCQMATVGDVVGTAEELNALPMDSVVWDSQRIAHQHIEHGDNGPLHWWNPYNEKRDWVHLPAIVLHLGAS